MTMRVADAGPERRDALAHDWAVLLRAALPRSLWVPVPNVGDDVLDLVDGFRLDGFILTGGEDFGTSALRDATERRLLERCTAGGLPVLAVCRGLQLVQSACGGRLAPVPAPHDGGSEHAIHVVHERGARLVGATPFAAPSFHRWGVRVEDLAPALEPLALADDGVVEMLAHRSAPLVAVQWHPERPLAEPERALSLLRGCWDA